MTHAQAARRRIEQSRGKGGPGAQSEPIQAPLSTEEKIAVTSIAARFKRHHSSRLPFQRRAPRVAATPDQILASHSGTDLVSLLTPKHHRSAENNQRGVRSPRRRRAGDSGATRLRPLSTRTQRTPQCDWRKPWAAQALCLHDGSVRTSVGGASNAIKRAGFCIFGSQSVMWILAPN